MCDTTMADDPKGLRCQNDGPHQPHHGCQYESSTGSQVPDRHGDQG